MEMNRGLFVGASMLAALAAMAQEASVRYDTDNDRSRTAWVDTTSDWRAFKGNELNFNIFGTGTVGERTLDHASLNRFKRDGRLGAGGGIQYFFHRNLGVDVEAYTENTDHNFIDYVNGNLIARFPLGKSGVAPYILGGGGRQLDPIYQWHWDAGGGIEWRFAPHIGIFVDARYVWPDETEDYGMGRGGLRFGF